MKNLILLIVVLFSVLQATAQAPQKFNYQGIARNQQGEVMANRTMALKIGVLSAVDTELPDFEEIHQVKTNEFGLYSLEIGTGEALMGSIATVRWETGNKYIRVAIDPNGGSNFDVIGTNQLLSVPYALYSDKAGIAKTIQGGSRAGSVSTSAAGTGTINFLSKFTAANTIYNSQVFDNGTNVGIGTTNPLYKLHIEKSSGTADILIRSTDPVSAAAFRLRNSNNDEFGLNKFGPNAAGSYMGVPRSNLAIFNNATSGALVYNAQGDMVFGNTISGVQLPRLSIKSSSGNIGVGTVNPDASAVMDLTSTSKGFLPPRMTTAQRNTIANPADGLVIFNTNTGCLNYRFSGNWMEMCGTVIPTIASLNCASSIQSGILTASVITSAANSSIAYTGGNGAVHNGQIVASTGVIGLTATLSQGTFANGTGNLIYTISGTPTSSGVASFLLDIGGQTCVLSRYVNPAPSFPAGSIFCNGINTGIVDVLNPATNKTWMDRNLGASQVANSSTDSLAYGDLYQWGRRSDGHQCRSSNTTSSLSSIDQPANGNFILVTNSPYDWRNPPNANLWQGANGINNPCPNGYRLPSESELEAERLSWNSNDPNGAYASPLKFPVAGARNQYFGSLGSVGTNGYYWSSSVIGNDGRGLAFGTAITNGILYFSRATGLSVRCLKELVGTVGSIDCGSSTNNGSLINGYVANNVTGSIPYLGGNGGYYSTTTINSTNVLGLTATITQGFFANGVGSLNYTISGTPTSTGIANFVLNIGGQTCIFSRTVSPAPSYPAGSIFCNGINTYVIDIYNPITGKTWMDRNLGASQVANSSADSLAFGDLYQWGRRSDGHQCRTSSNTYTLSSTDQPLGNFILVSNNPYDWRVPQNSNLWQGVNGVNNPCPIGYRLPTDTELEAERLSWSTNDAIGAFASPLKLPLSGFRNQYFGSVEGGGLYGYYWTSSVSGGQSGISQFGSGITSSLIYGIRAYGLAVRCIKN